jgi:hypothetical protein
MGERDLGNANVQNISEILSGVDPRITVPRAHRTSAQIMVTSTCHEEANKRMGDAEKALELNLQEQAKLYDDYKAVYARSNDIELGLDTEGGKSGICSLFFSAFLSSDEHFKFLGKIYDLSLLHE